MYTITWGWDGFAPPRRRQVRSSRVCRGASPGPEPESPQITRADSAALGASLRRRFRTVDDEADSALIMQQKSYIFVRGHTTPVLLSTFTTHHHRRCPYRRGKVYRERRKGPSNLTLVLAVRQYRCADCDMLHYRFCFWYRAVIFASFDTGSIGIQFDAYRHIP